MIDKCRIRPFETDDLARLHEIREAAFRPVFKSFRGIVGKKIAAVALARLEQEQAEHLDRICEAESSHDVFVVVYGSDIVAFCCVSMDHNCGVGEIDLNAVHPSYQGNGIGTWMYETVLERMRVAGMRVATVGTGGDPSHAPARKAYENAGFDAAISNVYLYRAL